MQNDSKRNVVGDKFTPEDCWVLRRHGELRVWGLGVVSILRDGEFESMVRLRAATLVGEGGGLMSLKSDVLGTLNLRNLQPTP